MSRMVSKKTLVLSDIWQAYVKKILAANPEYWTRFEKDTSNYVIYRKNNNRVEEVINYTTYRKIITTYINKAKKAIINGEAIDMGSNVGKICARRVERDFRKKRQEIDWGKTNSYGWSLAKDGKRIYNKIVFFTNDDWCRIGWHKTHSIVNETMYEFAPCKSNYHTGKGFKLEFNTALKNDELLKYQYLYFTIRQDKLEK